jgi:hypothetical protein
VKTAADIHLVAMLKVIGTVTVVPTATVCRPVPIKTAILRLLLLLLLLYDYGLCNFYL